MYPIFAVVSTVAKESFVKWKEDHVPRMAAGLAFFTAFSIGPLLVVAISITGLVVGRDAARGEVYGQFQELAGNSVARSLQKLVPSSSHPAGDAWKALLAFLLLVIGASKVLTELKKSLNAMWGVATTQTTGAWPWIRGRLLSIALVLTGSMLPLLPVALDAGLETTGGASVLADIPALTRVLEAILTVALITVLFVLTFKYLPSRPVKWKAAWIGGILTALLFLLGRSVLELFISISPTRGAAGALTLLLIWVYYSAHIVLAGAEITVVIERRLTATDGGSSM